MSEEQHHLEVGERFPKDVRAPELSDLVAELGRFGLESVRGIKLIDSTHDASDIRLNYIVDRTWVLRFCNAPDMTEKRIGDWNRLIGRYRAMGLRCPAFIADQQGKYLYSWGPLMCYLSEFIDLPIADSIELEDEEKLIAQVAMSVARFAETYRDVDLSETMGMYSLFDLSPFDIPQGIDEKQDNFNQLVALLREREEAALADRLERRHADVRRKLKAVYRALPRCVFQGDENLSNVLVDDAQRFAGFIDFNMAGTEVCVNQLVNLVGFDYDEKRQEPIGAEARLDFALRHFHSRITPLLEVYHATALERQAIAWYAWIVMVAQWPNLCFFRYAITEGKLKEEICELLALIADLPEDRLAVGVGQKGETTMERFAWKGRIKPGMEAEYKRRHDEIWPEMLALLRAAGIHNYSIWSDGRDVFGYYECEKGIEFAEKTQAQSPVVDRWNDYMEDVLELVMDPETGAQPKLQRMFLME